MRLHHRLHLVERLVVLRIGAAEEIGDLVGVGVPGGTGGGNSSRVARLGRRCYLRRQRDVVVKQRRQLVAGRVAGEGLMAPPRWCEPSPFSNSCPMMRRLFLGGHSPSMAVVNLSTQSHTPRLLASFERF